MEVDIFLTILFGLLTLRVFATSMYGLFGKGGSTFTDNQKKGLSVFWLMASVITTVLFLQVLI